MVKQSIIFIFVPLISFSLYIAIFSPDEYLIITYFFPGCFISFESAVFCNHSNNSKQSQLGSAYLYAV